jgi:hypothetical protein
MWDSTTITVKAAIAAKGDQIAQPQGKSMIGQFASKQCSQTLIN